MINTLLYQTFIFGVLDISYTPKQIKDIKIKDLISILQSLEDYNLGYYWSWRYYRNIKTLFNTWDSAIETDYNIVIGILEMIEEIFKIVKKLEINISNIDNIEDNIDNIAFILILKYIDEKIKFIERFADISWAKKIREKWKNTFERLYCHYRHIFIFCDYSIPYNDNLWSPSWSVNFLDTSTIIPSVDLFTDYYFKCNNFKFNKYMNNDIEYLYTRIKFLQRRAPIYYDEHIKKNISRLTKIMFQVFPYNSIYDDYFKLLQDTEEVYIPSMLNYIDIKKINQDVWLLAILPKYVTAYLLGFPIISSDIPSDKNFYPIMSQIIEKGLKNYHQKIYENNRKLIDIRRMNIECANNKDNENILDLTYNLVENYNSDDTLLFFNEGVCHLFTYPEFNDLISKERNPYNRNNMPLFTHVLSTLKLKKKIKRHLNYRFLKVELNSTMEDNFNIIKQRIQDKPEYSSDYTYTTAFLNLFLNSGI